MRNISDLMVTQIMIVFLGLATSLFFFIVTAVGGNHVVEGFGETVLYLFFTVIIVFTSGLINYCLFPKLRLPRFINPFRYSLLFSVIYFVPMFLYLRKFY